MRLNPLLATAIAFALAGCVTATSGGAAVVVVSERAAVAQCQNLGQIHSQSLWGGVAATGVAYNNVLSELKNDTAQRGGTHLLLVNLANTLGGSNAIGDAYRCG